MMKVVGFISRRIDLVYAIEGVDTVPLAALHLLTDDGLIKLIAKGDYAERLFEEVKKGMKIEVSYDDTQTWNALPEGDIPSRGKILNYKLLS
ncbi:hypothetical protein G7059_00035 [Erysipelothrix sp. HDW6A]|uniref:hypothetical protein n=1 Tax=Erysipelothrix sp. HDW6A TaxID=2714928 RepID=UPI00140C10ED|nr:hypothetical protein [Erysipelothrix sp. HDW6A]QIK56343.1 hypothetical protein G7059_00035 [Erysipelothrix sp. HDW6A]